MIAHGDRANSAWQVAVDKVRYDRFPRRELQRLTVRLSAQSSVNARSTNTSHHTYIPDQANVQLVASWLKIQYEWRPSIRVIITPKVKFVIDIELEDVVDREGDTLGT